MKRIAKIISIISILIVSFSMAVYASTDVTIEVQVDENNAKLGNIYYIVYLDNKPIGTDIDYSIKNGKGNDYQLNISNKTQEAIILHKDVYYGDYVITIAEQEFLITIDDHSVSIQDQPQILNLRSSQPNPTTKPTSPGSPNSGNLGNSISSGGGSNIKDDTNPKISNTGDSDLKNGDSESVVKNTYDPVKTGDDTQICLFLILFLLSLILIILAVLYVKRKKGGEKDDKK